MTELVAEPAADQDLNARPFASLYREYDYPVRDIDGALPADLVGTLFRIGPGKFEVGDTVVKTMFDGDGMVSRFILDGSGVRFTNRYVRTPQFRDSMRGTMQTRGITTNAPGLRGNLRWPANTANTNIVSLCGDLLALWEGGPPHQVDPDTLETLGTKSFPGDRLGYVGAFSAHPKWDPDTRECFNFGLDLFPTPRLRCHRIDSTGRNTELTSIPLWDMVWNHDFALTARHLVFVLDPVRPSLKELFRTRSLERSLEYQLRNGSTRFVLVPRDGSAPRIIEHPPLAHVHVTNAFEDGTDTVVEFIRFIDPTVFARIGRETERPIDPANPRAHLVIDEWPRGHLARYRISPSGRITETVLSEVFPMEFPQYDWRRSTREHSVTYAAAATSDRGHYNSIVKIDHRTGTTTRCDFGLSQTGEPLFVARPGGVAEDDGWLLAVNHDLPSHRSQLVILDARDLEAGPLAVAHLEHHLPLGFHGTFSRRVARPEAPLPHPTILGV
ncbi:dioxygenase [Mycobacterium sp. ACS4331]|nr:dioxygenase [Mycobacterium sp. ACS4331]